MTVEINNRGFKQALALLKDALFELEFDKNNPTDLKNYKLYKARIENPDFELELAEMICGDGENNFPYRSSSFLTKFFQKLNLNYAHDGTTRRFWVKDVLLELTISELAIIIEKGLFDKKEFRCVDKNNYEENYKKAIKEFRIFIDESLELNSSVNLLELLDLNINAELLFDNKVDTKDMELNKLIQEAKERFFNPKDKQIAIEKLWDAFERIKTYFGVNKRESAEQLVELISKGFEKDLFNAEFTILTKIGNNYRIRHHETDKKEITDNKHLNYLFFRMLTLIDLCLNSIRENK